MKSDEAPLMAASPMVSGMAGFESIAGYRFKVVVDSDKDHQKIKEIIKKMDGELDNPNLEVPKCSDDLFK